MCLSSIVKAQKVLKKINRKYFKIYLRVKQFYGVIIDVSLLH